MKGADAILNVVTYKAFNDDVILRQRHEGGKDIGEFKISKERLQQVFKWGTALRQFRCSDLYKVVSRW